MGKRKEIDLRFPDRDFLNRNTRKKIAEYLDKLYNKIKEANTPDKRSFEEAEQMKTKEKLQEELIKILQSFVPNLQNDEYNKLKIELAELKESTPQVTPQGAEEILERYAEGINEDGSPYLSNKSIIKAMEEHRQQGRPTEEEIGYKADEHSEFIGVGGIKNNNIARQVSFMQGARWAINKWKGE